MSFPDEDLTKYLADLPQDILQELNDDLDRQNGPQIPSMTEPGAFWEDLPPVLPQMSSLFNSQSIPVGEFGTEGSQEYLFNRSSSKFFGLDPAMFGLAPDYAAPSWQDIRNSSNLPNLEHNAAASGLNASANVASGANVPVKAEKEELPPDVKREGSITLKREPSDLAMKREGSFGSSPSSQKAREQLDALIAVHQIQSDELDVIHQTLKNLTISDQEQFTSLQSQLFRFQSQVKAEIREVGDINKRILLSPEELRETTGLSQKLVVQYQRSEVYSKELASLPKDENMCIATIAILEQPLPQIVFKSRQMDGSYVVKLITGTKIEVTKGGRVSVSVTGKDREEDASEVSNRESPLSKKTETSSTSQAITSFNAQFTDIRLNQSSKMLPVTLTFKTTVRSKNREEFTCISPPTYPIIVITNESQWGEAAGKLLFADAFGNHEDVPWLQFANSLHRLVLRSTVEIAVSDKIDKNIDLARDGLVEWEFNYIHFKFFENKSRVSKKEAKVFWDWFGHVLTTIRFKRHIKTLWFNGLIYGLVTKKDCHRILKNEQPGAFLIRFSDSVAGSFAVAYTDDSAEKVKHYLIKPEDIGANKTLPAFLREKHHFKNLVHFNYAKMKIFRTDKRSAFKEFFAQPVKKKGHNNADLSKLGYVQDLDGQT
eukprot:TRINITY_DN5006_c0_g1_i1.p1 TRINITY_DN5006_c0_g1~~TRINITY_DN5006_c0_g1_i1.p1  ORF type:complete len:657 (-),score=188.01 TRINITY_DN5006_c0_g1_i1:30-2000(-)